MNLNLAEDHPTTLLKACDEILEQVIDDYEDYSDMRNDNRDEIKKHIEWIKNLRKARELINLEQ